jgi:flagellar biogenesis protein FliO
MPSPFAALLTLAASGVAAASSPVFVRDARTSWDGETFVLQVEGEAAFGARSVESSLLGRLLVLAIDDSRVHESKRSWQGGTVRAHRHDYHTELSTALPRNAACSGSIRVTRTEDGGLRATMACKGDPVASAALPSVAAQPSVAAAKPAPLPKVASVGAGSVGEAKLKAALALAPASSSLVAEPAPAAPPAKAAAQAPPAQVPPAKAAAQVPPARAAAQVVPAASSSSVAAPAAPTPAERAPVVAPKPAPGGALVPTPTSKPAEAPAQPVVRAGDRGSDLQTVAVPLVALVLLCGLGLWRRRVRPGASRVVRILETASLGPKRSLIVAEVAGQRLVLGASEAGITLLESRASAPSAATLEAPPMTAPAPDAALVGAGPVPSLAGEDARARAALVDASDDLGEITVEEPAPAGQAHVLARLFSGRRRPARQDFARLLRGAQVPRPVEELEDSLEDRELRAKLAAGIPVVTRGGRAA